MFKALTYHVLSQAAAGWIEVAEALAADVLSALRRTLRPLPGRLRRRRRTLRPIRAQREQRHPRGGPHHHRRVDHLRLSHHHLRLCGNHRRRQPLHAWQRRAVFALLSAAASSTHRGKAGGRQIGGLSTGLCLCEQFNETKSKLGPRDIRKSITWSYYEKTFLPVNCRQ